MKYILTLILFLTPLITKAEDLPECFKIGNIITYDVAKVTATEGPYKITEIKAKWIHLVVDETEKGGLLFDKGWWNTDLMIRVRVSRKE